MKKKGFTLVELLAVIAILAILVIVAMPNVLGMFNQAKSSTFVTEVQTLMDTAKTDFMRLQLESQGSAIEYSHLTSPATLNNLDLDGADKYYYIEMDRYGNYNRVVVWDVNFCYDSASTAAGLTAGKFDKTDIKAAHLYNNATDLKDTSLVYDSTNNKYTVPTNAFCGTSLVEG